MYEKTVAIQSKLVIECEPIMLYIIALDIKIVICSYLSYGYLPYFLLY